MAKKDAICETCKNLTDIHPKKSYGVCQRARNTQKNKNPYRRFDDSCPSYSATEGGIE